MSPSNVEGRDKEAAHGELGRADSLFWRGCRGVEGAAEEEPPSTGGGPFLMTSGTLEKSSLPRSALLFRN